MICEVCSDKIEAGEKSVMHKGARIHEGCYLILDDDFERRDDQPEPDELELAYRRGDEVATIRRTLHQAGAACARGSDDSRCRACDPC